MSDRLMREDAQETFIDSEQSKYVGWLSIYCSLSEWEKTDRLMTQAQTIEELWAEVKLLEKQLFRLGVTPDTVPF